VILEGEDIQTINAIELRQRVGMLFQKPTPFSLSIARNIEFPPREHGKRDREECDRLIEESLRDVGLWDEVKGLFST